MATVMRPTEESLAPRHSPVDIPPHPENRSNNSNSAFLGIFSKVFNEDDT